MFTVPVIILYIVEIAPSHRGTQCLLLPWTFIFYNGDDVLLKILLFCQEKSADLFAHFSVYFNHPLLVKLYT